MKINPVDLWNRFARERRRAAVAEGDYWLEKAEAYSRRFDQRWAEGDDETRDYLVRLFAGRSIGSVLDIGAGTGQWSLFFARMGADVTALEPSAGMRAVMRKNIEADPAAAKRIRIVDGRWPERGTERYDLSFCSHAMYEWDDLAGAIAALRERTLRRVVLAICAPYADDFYARLAVRIRPEAPYSGMDFPLLYAALFEMGILADVCFESRETGHVRRFDSVDAAVSAIRARFDAAADAATIRALILSEGYADENGRVKIPMHGKTACVSF